MKLTKEQFDKFMQHVFEKQEKPPNLFCVYIDKGKTMYNEFDLDLNLLGGGNIIYLIDRLNKLPK